MYTRCAVEDEAVGFRRLKRRKGCVQSVLIWSVFLPNEAVMYKKTKELKIPSLLGLAANIGNL